MCSNICHLAKTRLYFSLLLKLRCFTYILWNSVCPQYWILFRSYFHFLTLNFLFNPCGRWPLFIVVYRTRKMCAIQYQKIVLDFRSGQIQIIVIPVLFHCFVFIQWRNQNKISTKQNVHREKGSTSHTHKIQSNRKCSI